ncbi:MAG: EAL domain-containing protein [Minicystis sp.]
MLTVSPYSARQTAPPPAPEVLLAQVLLGNGIRSVYQPIVCLDDGEVVAYEALARGPRGTRLEAPDVLFAVARDSGLLAELEWSCRTAALEGALEAALPASSALFMNVEPGLLGLPAPASHLRILGEARRRLRVIVEITERAITHRPTDLLRALDEAREHGWGIALDDVGANPESLALLPLIHPDVIKLDMALVQGAPSRATAQVLSAVLAEAERTGATILAEGIETLEHVETALALGATLGQGWFYGRPGPLPTVVPRSDLGLRLLPRASRASLPTPYDVVSAAISVRRGRRDLLLAISMHFEHQASAMGDTPVVLGAFQTADRFTRATATRYARLAAKSSLVAALAHGLSAEPAPGVRGASLDPGDPLLNEWSVVVLGPHYAGALVARDLGDGGPEAQRRFDFAITHDRALVIAAAASLMAKIAPRAHPVSAEAVKLRST